MREKMVEIGESDSTLSIYTHYNLKNKKGITLVALVITIIILLILAGITVSQLSENGIFENAKLSRRKSEISQIIESARIKILEEQMDNNGDIKEDKLNEIIVEYDKDGEIKTNADNEKYIVTSKGYEIKVLDIWNEITSNILDFDADTLTIGEAININKYGETVNYVSKYEKDNKTTIGWKLFYQDNNYAYLITDGCIGNYKPSDYYSKYENGKFVSTIGQKLNPAISSIFVETKTDGYVKAVAWLTDSEVWKEYTNADSIFAIGSTTLELFKASYESEGTKGVLMDTNDTGYIIKNTGKWIDSKYRNSMYICSNTYWLSSLSYNYLMAVRDTWLDMVTYDVENASFPVRPIVCMKSSVFNTKYNN